MSAARKKQAEGVPVSRRGLIQRINRALAKQDEQLKTTRGDGRARQELGDYYLLDFELNAVTEKNVDPEALARELGVLKPYERVTG
jgi:hypothetical protein